MLITLAYVSSTVPWGGTNPVEDNIFQVGTLHKRPTPSSAPFLVIMTRWSVELPFPLEHPASENLHSKFLIPIFICGPDRDSGTFCGVLTIECSIFCFWKLI